MEKVLRLLLLVSLLALVVLTSLWLLHGLHTPDGPAEIPASAASPAPRESEEPAVPADGPEADPEAVPGEDPEALYTEALTAVREERWSEALPLLEALGEHGDAPALAETCRVALYETATAHLRARELREARLAFQPLGDYRDSLRWLRYCLVRENADTPAVPLMSPQRVLFRPDSGLGTVYYCLNGLLYVPAECGPDTRVVVYFPGGSDPNPTLNRNAVYDYVSRYAPDAVCLFAHINGLFFMEEHERTVWATVEQLLQECSLVPHELYLVGTSNGFYTAMDLAVRLLDEYDLPVRAVMSWDAGEDWSMNAFLLKPRELRRLAAESTRFVLFEQRHFDTDRSVIRDMLDAGLSVSLVECSNGDHEKITENAFRYGALSWLLGEADLTEKEYALRELRREE